MNSNKTSSRSKTRTPTKKQDINVRRSPRKKQQESHEKGRRKLEFNKDKKLQRERLKGFVVFVDVPNAPSKLKEIKERVAILGGKVEEFLDKKVNLVITSQKPLLEKSNGQTVENSPLSALGPSPQAILSNKNSIKCSPYSTDSPQFSVDGVRRENRPVSRSQMLLNKVLSNRKGAGTTDIWGTAKNIGAKVFPADDFMRKYMQKKTSSVTGDTTKSLKGKSLNQSQLRNFSTSKILTDIKVSKAVLPCFKIEDKSFAFRPIVHEFKTWREISYETSLNQSPFDVPKLKTKSKTKLEIPCEQPSSNNDEETISLAIKSEKISETVEDEVKTKKISKDDKNAEKPGYCDCCSLRFKELRKHLRSDNHRRFATNPSNFKNLDRLIDQGTLFQTFVSDLKAISRINKINQELFPNSSSSTTCCATPTQASVVSLSHCNAVSSLMLSSQKQNIASSKLKEPCRLLQAFCSPIKNSPQKQKLVVSSPRRSPRINRYPLTHDAPESPLRTSHIPISTKFDSTFLYPVVSSTPAKLESTPVISYPAITNLTMTAAPEPILPPPLSANVKKIPSALLQKCSPHKPVLIEEHQENGGKIGIGDNCCCDGLLSTVTLMSESDKPVRKVKKKRKHSRSHRSSQSIATGSTQNSQTNDEINIEKHKSLKPDNVQLDLEIKINEKKYIMDRNISSNNKICNINTDNVNNDNINNDNDNINNDNNDNINNNNITNNNITNDNITNDNITNNNITIDNNDKISNNNSNNNKPVEPEQDETLLNTNILDIVPVDCLSQTSSFNLEPVNNDLSDPEVTINTKNRALFGDISLCQYESFPQEEQMSEEFPFSSIGGETQERPEKADEKEETDILLKSFAEENFSNDSIKENSCFEKKSKPCFLGFTDPETKEMEEYCDIGHCSNEHLEKEEEKTDIMEVDQVGQVSLNLNHEDSVVHTKNETKFSISTVYSKKKLSTGLDFSDDDEEKQYTGRHGFDQQLSNLTNKIIEVEDFQGVDDISVAIFKQGSTPNRGDASSLSVSRRNRSSNSSQQQPPMSPTVVTGHLTPLKRNFVDNNLVSSPLSFKGNLRSHKTSSSDQSVPVVNLNLNNNKKRRATTPVSVRSRKRSRTSSNLDSVYHQSNTTAANFSLLNPPLEHKDDFDDVFEFEPSSEPLEQRLEKESKIPDKENLKTKSRSKSTSNTNKKISPSMEVDISKELFGNMNTLLDRIKRRSRQSEASSSKSSSSRSCSPSNRKSCSEKAQCVATSESRPKPILLRRSPRKRQEEWSCSSPNSNRFKMKFERKKCSPFEDPCKGMSHSSKHINNTSAILGDFEENEEESSLLEDSSSKTPSAASNNKKKSSSSRSSKKDKNKIAQKSQLKVFRGKCDQDNDNIVSEFEAHADLTELTSTFSKQRPGRKCKTNIEGLYWEEEEDPRFQRKKKIHS